MEYRPDYPNAHCSLGLAYQGLGQWDKAILSFEEELKYHPDQVYAFIYLGDIYSEMGDYPKALEQFQRALSYPNLPPTERIQEKISFIEEALKQRQKEKK